MERSAGSGPEPRAGSADNTAVLEDSASPAFWVLLLPTLRRGVCPKTGRLSPPAMDEHVTQAGVVPVALIHRHGPCTEFVA